MANNFDKNWTTVNNNYPLNDKEVERYISVKPSANQLALVDKPFYTFMHFGMNTATDREWGAGVEKATDFTIKSIDAKQWVETAKSAGATGVILTCKHHDGFCLWPSEYTSFCVKNSSYKGDIVKEVSDECHKQGMDFGVYLSPWDMHDERYGTDAYNDYFCNQLTELLTNYGEIFEVWFDGAKGSNAKKFEYDWQRYYDLIRKLQPKANIAICGPDIRWVGNEGGKSRKSEYSVVPCALREADRIMALSQQDENQASSLQKYNQMDEDLGSRKILEKNAYICWFPAEVDVSIPVIARSAAPLDSDAFRQRTDDFEPQPKFHVPVHPFPDCRNQIFAQEGVVLEQKRMFDTGFAVGGDFFFDRKKQVFRSARLTAADKVDKIQYGTAHKQSSCFVISLICSCISQTVRSHRISHKTSAGCVTVS